MVFCILKYDSVIGCENVLYGFGDIPDNWVQNIAQKETMKGIADSHGVKVAQILVAWAIAKGAFPIIGVTKVAQVEDAALLL